MKHYCITGGIGSGKSFVCKVLNNHGIEIYDTDKEARRLINTSPVIHDRLVALMGQETYVDGRYNTAHVTQFLLASEENKQAINAIVHPAVMEDFYASGMQWMECAIIYEAHLEHYVDKVVAVIAPEDVRIKRIMARDSINEERATQWVHGQINQDEVKSKADYVIVNDGQRDIEEQVKQLLGQIKD